MNGVVVATFSTNLQQYIAQYKLCRTVNGTTVEIATATGYEYNAGIVPYSMTDASPVVGMQATYNLKHVDNMNGAETTIATVIITPTAISEHDPDNAIGIYPNPMVDVLTLELPPNVDPVDVTVVNAIGQVVLSYAQLATDRDLLVNDLQEGVYLMRLSRDDVPFRTVRLLKTE